MAEAKGAGQALPSEPGASGCAPSSRAAEEKGEVAPRRDEPLAAGCASLKAYSVGDPVPSGTRRLHLNEFQFQHAPGVIDALRSAVGSVSIDTLLTHYPSGADPSLVDHLAKYVGCGATRTNVIVAAGSDEILRAVIDTCGLRGHRKLLMGVPGYTHFEHYARLRELEIVPYSIVGPAIRLSTEEHLASIGYYDRLLTDGCLVYLCSPNNPTGDIWTKKVVSDLVTRYPKSFFLLDEAYIEFASVDTFDELARNSAPVCDATSAQMLNHASVVSVALEHRNIVVARTMSKAFGLASLRIGYAVAHADTIKALQVAVSPKAFGPIAARVACSVFDEGNLSYYVGTTRDARRSAREAVAELSRRGWVCLDGRGNFFLVYVGENPSAAVHKLAIAGVQVRNRDDLQGLQGFVRVTSGTDADTTAIIKAFLTLKPPIEPPMQTLFTPKIKLTAVKTLLRRVVQVMDAAGVEFWAQGGTMLSIVRHGGMMQWDDDADLAYRLGLSGADPVGGLRSAFAGAGLILQRNRTDAYWQVGTNAEGEVISPIHVDIFSYSLEENSDGAKYVLGDPRFRDEDPSSAGAHCNTKYSPGELFPLRTVPFYDYSLAIPHKSEEVLARALGPDYMKVARIRKGDAATGTHVAYPLRDRSPA